MLVKDSLSKLAVSHSKLSVSQLRQLIGIAAALPEHGEFIQSQALDHQLLAVTTQPIDSVFDVVGTVDIMGDLLAASKLARVMQEVGFACSADEASFRGVLEQCGGQLSEQAVAEVLTMMAQTQQAANIQGADQLSLASTLAIIANGGAAAGADGSAQSGWNWKVVLDVIKRQAPGLKWERIAELFDHPGFSIPDQQGFVLLVSAYKYGSGEQLPVKAVVGRVWGNHAGQLSTLRHAVSAAPELFSFQGSERKLAPVEGLHGGKSSVGTPNHAWLSVDLLQVLCYLVVEPMHQPVVREILETPVKQCPEVRVDLGPRACMGVLTAHACLTMRRGEERGTLQGMCGGELCSGCREQRRGCVVGPGWGVWQQGYVTSRQKLTVLVWSAVGLGVLGSHPSMHLPTPLARAPIPAHVRIAVCTPSCPTP